MLFFYFLFCFNSLILSRGEIYIFDSEKNLLKKGENKIYLEKNFYNVYDLKYDPLWIYILLKDGLYVINPLKGKIVSFYKFKQNYLRFTKDDEGNFYFLTPSGKIKIINFTRRDSFYLDFYSKKNALKFEFFDKKLYFVYKDEIVFFDLVKKEVGKEIDGKWNGIFKYLSNVFLWKENCIKIKDEDEKEICINFKIDDLLVFKDTIFILSSDSIIKLPFKEIK